MRISLLIRTLLVLLVLLWGCSNVFASDMSKLIDRGCTRCHKKVFKALEQVGGAHASAVECRDCHLEHPKQRGADYQVEDCATCHEPDSKKHFASGDCRQCHQAHRPLMVDFSTMEPPVEPICLSCHESPAGTGSTAHADSLSCTQCHTSHTTIAECLSCHEGHSQTAAKEPCLSCHAAHNPLPELAAKGLTAKSCSVCHPGTSTDMTAATSAHGQLACDQCHLEHRDKPDCLQCHQGHTEQMTGDDCRSCHSPHTPMPPVFTTATKSAFCEACHDEVSATFTATGGAHQQNLTCTECHQNHPPATISVLACVACHEGTEDPHFLLTGCQQCHPPHEPSSMEQDLSQVDNVLAACASCHAQVLEEMTQDPSAHSEALACYQCHQTHGESASCRDCHEGHDESMSAADCRSCHQPHNPAPAQFSAEVTAAFCVGCHGPIVETFNSSGKAHQAELSCIDCHAQHPPGEGVLPACTDCHAAEDNPHFASADCASCHDPHQPLSVELHELRGSRAVCAGCHSQVEVELTTQVSAHDRDCVTCHRQHVGVPSCLGCHLGHGEGMSKADCLSCHQPHAPLQIVFQAEPGSQLCAACHVDVAAAVAAEGGGHRDNIDCSACHQQHPAAGCATCHSEHPQKGVAIAGTCFACHAPSEHSHYTVGDCLDCHTPHQPLLLDLTTRTPLTPVCLSCHASIGKLFAAQPGGHSDQGCANCHLRHTQKRICIDCHDSHEESMEQADCLLCHAPHQPQNIQLQRVENIPSKFCASCHEGQAKALSTKGGQHQQKIARCTVCHPQHRPNGTTLSVECSSCHIKARRRHFTLKNCASCHNPHQPQEPDLSALAEVRATCISCHNNQERLLKQYPNKHSEFDCRKCHAGKHGSKMACQDCHQPHIPKMTQIDCLKCHPPHLPQMIREKPGQAGAVCRGCHQQPADKLAKQGAAHKKQSCVSCHPAHPPYGKKVVASCAVCHDGDDNPHFAADNCQGCHLGHQPLGLSMAAAKNVRPACVACHDAVAEEFVGGPSKHAEQECTSCHQRHAESLTCGDCHQPHDATMAKTACLSCHGVPHVPTRVVFAEQLPAALCQSCHQLQVTALANDQSAHQQLACATCHLGEHGTKQECSSCHEPPHDPGLHRKFPDCLKCHLDPHDLADWRDTQVAGGTDPIIDDNKSIPAAPGAVSSEGSK